MVTPFGPDGALNLPLAEQLADLLVGSAPAGMSHVYFVSGGS